MIQLFIAAAGLAMNSPPARPLPKMEIIVLSPEPSSSDGQGADYLVRRTRELLATMHDQGIATIRFSDVDSESYAACFAKAVAADGDSELQQDRCVQAAVPRHPESKTVAVVVRQMRWRSAAQQLTCITAGDPGVGRSAVHLGDIFHRYDFVRAAARSHARQCLATALGQNAPRQK